MKGERNRMEKRQGSLLIEILYTCHRVRLRPSVDDNDQNAKYR